MESVSMAELTLYDSNVCRLCAADNPNCEFLYTSENEEPDLSSMVNRYLPIKIRDDGKLPRRICPGCNIQLEATIQFFDLLVEGQRKIREMWKLQSEMQRKNVRERLRAEREHTELAEETPELDDYGESEEKDPLAQQIIIKIMPDGSIYSAEHDMSLQMEGLEKPRRKRGRPPKVQVEEEGDKIIEELPEIGSQEEDDKQDEEDEIDGDGRRRRKRKAPKRYSEAVQGKELERIFKEEGVIDDEDDETADHDYDETDERPNISTPDGNEEVIGHLETEEGKDLGELVIVNRGRGRGRPKLRRRKTKFTCNLCGKGFSQRSRYVIHKSFHKAAVHECVECKTQFSNANNLLLHQKTTGHIAEGVIESISDDIDNPVQEKLASIKENSAEETYATEQDSLAMPGIQKEESLDLNSSNEYEMIEELDKTFDCDECKKQYTTKESLEEHLTLDHPEDEKPYTCTFCDKIFSYQSSLKSHILTHETGKSDKSYPCDICGKVLNHPSSVVYHKEAEHNNGRRFVCNKCGKSFKHKQLLQRHQLVHSEDRPYICKSCNASFKTKANLINHQSTHTGEKKYTCSICQQQFAHKTSLTLHYRWHNGLKPYECNVCQKTFSQNGNLQEHMRIHTGEKPYCCDDCGRKFTTSSQFKLHVKRHTGERPWKCEYCVKSFLHKDTWKCHVRRHKNERPFQCTDCDRGFTEQWALKKHKRMHTGEKPYSCDICGKRFSDCSNLTKHKKVHRENRTVGSGEIWQILPTQNDEHSLSEQQYAIAPVDGSEDGGRQIVYLTYQDPDDPNQSRTSILPFNIYDGREEIPGSAGQSLPTLDVEDPEITEDKTGGLNAEGTIEMDFPDQNMQLHITDEDGNSVPLTFQENGKQFIVGGQFVSHDGQMIKVHSGDFSGELAGQLGVHVADSIEMAEINDADNPDQDSIIRNAIHDQDADGIIRILEEENDNSENSGNVTQIDTSNVAELEGEERTIQLITEDGRTMQLLTRFNGDLNSEYVTIV